MNQLNYQLSGQDPTKPYVVLLHGLFGSLENLFAVKRGLQDNFNIVSVDLPDHGKSPRSKQFSFAGYASQVEQLLQSLSIEHAHILGHSLGGKVAMQLALSNPAKVLSLVIADIAPVDYEPRHHNVITGLQKVDLTQLSSRNEADKILSTVITESGVRQFLLKSLVQIAGQWQWRFNLELLTRDYSKLSAGIDSDSPFDGPVLFIKGGKSDYLLLAHQEKIKRLFPNSQAKIMSSAGHWLHAENPTVFVRLVEAFLNAQNHN